MFQLMKQKKNELLFTYHRWKYAEGKYFRSWKGSTSDENQPWEILKGKYKGVVFYFDKLQIRETGIGFNVYFHHAEYDKKGNPLSTGNAYKKFHKIASKILLVLLYTMIHDENGPIQFGLKPGEEYEDRNDYPEEPFTERTVYKKSSSLFKE